MGLARILRERGLGLACTAHRKGSGIMSRYDAVNNPVRFLTIVTETPVERGCSATASHSQCTPTPGSAATPSLIHATGGGGDAMASLPATLAETCSAAGQTVLNLVDRIKHIGLGSVIGAAYPASGTDSGTATPSGSHRSSLCSLDGDDESDFSGLNSIMTMNNKEGFLTRGQAATGVVPQRRRVMAPFEYFCTRMSNPPSRPSSLSLSRIISKPSEATGPLPKSVERDNHAAAGAKPKRYSQDQHGGVSASGERTMTSSCSASASSSSSSRPVASSEVSKGNVATISQATSQSVSDSLLRHLGSAHMRSGGATAAAGLTQCKPKSGGQLL